MCMHLSILIEFRKWSESWSREWLCVISVHLRDMFRWFSQHRWVVCSVCLPLLSAETKTVIQQRARQPPTRFAVHDCVISQPLYVGPSHALSSEAPKKAKPQSLLLLADIWIHFEEMGETELFHRFSFVPFNKIKQCVDFKIRKVQLISKITLACVLMWKSCVFTLKMPNLLLISSF